LTSKSCLLTPLSCHIRASRAYMKFMFSWILLLGTDYHTSRERFLESCRPQPLVSLAVCLMAPVYPILQRSLGRFVTSTDLLAVAMLRLAIAGSPKKT
jgi:hypothetical protein